MAARQLLVNVRPFDSAAGVVGPLSTIVIDGQRITAITTEPVPADGAEVIDAGGRVVLPGLVDAHVHVTATSHDLTTLGLQPPSVLRFTSGDARVMLRAPGGNGAVDIWISDANNPIRDGDASHINILPFLPSAPSAPGHIVFGVYRSGPVLYLREVY